MILILMVLFLSFPSYASTTLTPVNISPYHRYSTATGSNSNGYATGSNSNGNGNMGGWGGGGWDGGNQRGNEKPVSDNNDSPDETINLLLDAPENDNDIAAETIPTELLTAEAKNVATPSSLPESKPNPTSYSSIILSDSQIKQQMLANPILLTFIKNNMKMVIPTELLANHLPKDLEQLKISMDFDGSDEFYIYLTVNQDVITDWSDMNYTIYLPWQGETENIYCYQTIDHKIAASKYEDGYLVFHLSQTGHYWIDSDEIIPGSSLLPPEIKYNYRSTSARDTLFSKHYLIITVLIPFIYIASKIARRKRSEQ